MPEPLGFLFPSVLCHSKDLWAIREQFDQSSNSSMTSLAFLITLITVSYLLHHASTRSENFLDV